MAFSENHLNFIDYIFIAASLLVSLGIGGYYAFAKQTTEDLLVGGRKMSPIPIAASMMVTYFSAISIIGYPSEIFYHGIQIFMMTIMTVFLVPISAYLLVPVFYKLKLTSVYEYLEIRFDSVLTRWLASFLFILQVTMLNGIVVYAPAIPLRHMVGIPIWLSIVGIAVCGTIYTSVGGLKAVIWTDTWQLIGILVGMLAIVIKGFMSAGGVSRVFTLAADNGRLDVFDFSFDPFMRHNTFNFIFGFGFTLICLYSTHQPQVQRYSSVPTLKMAIHAILFSIPLNVITMVLIVLTGLSIYAVYASCDPVRTGEIKMQDAIVPFFVTQQLSSIPGMLGLFISCIFNAVLSTLSSALNSLVAVTWEDFLLKIQFFKNMADSSKANMTRVIAAIYGTIIVGGAFMASDLGSILPLTMTGIGATSGPLAAVFIMGLFMPCINKHGAISGMLVGLIGMFAFVGQAFKIGSQHVPLPTSVVGCPEGSTLIPPPSYNHTAVDWPNKIFTLSYLLYPMLGAMMTVVVGLLVSVITGGCRKAHYRTIDPAYLHPLILKSGCCSGKQKLITRANASVTSRTQMENRVDRISAKNGFMDESSKSKIHYPYPYESVSTTSPVQLTPNPETVGERLLSRS